MNKPRIGILVLLLLVVYQSFSQEKKYPQDYFSSPVGFPIILSGNFAELRGNHFHSGIDITTQKEEGKTVFACADGYVSRIKISPYGYGKALYIDHPNGYTTVYAHMKGFSIDIGSWVKSEHYRQEQFDVDLFPVKGLLPVKKGEAIGFAGNSGTSEGPHLHFEVRETASEMPVDPQLFGFPVKDYIRPVMSSLMLYPEGEGSSINGAVVPLNMEMAGWGPVHRFRNKDTLKVAGKFSLGLQCYDLLNGSKNRNGINRYAVYIDSVLKFEWQAETFSFSETRYVNSFIDYEIYQRTGNRYLKTKIDPNNKLGMYRFARNRGIFTTLPDSIHHIKVVISDAGNNESFLRFVIWGETAGSTVQKRGSDKPLFYCLKENHFSGEGITISIPATSLYDDLNFEFSVSAALPHTCSKVYQIHNPGTPLHDYVDLTIVPDSAFLNLTGKLTLALLRAGKQPNSVGGQFEKGVFRARIREFGQFALMADTVNPVIKPLNIVDRKDISSQKTIRISISDDFSGIKSYRATLNGKWILMDYDAKNRLLEYQYDEQIVAGQNAFTLTVTDYCGNMNIYEAMLFNGQK